MGLDMYLEAKRHVAGYEFYSDVENVQEGKDDCGSYYVSRENLRDLQELCKRVLAESKLVPGEVYAGTTYRSGTATPEVEMEKGEVIADPSAASDLLPVQGGFFFGGTDYDEYYVRDLESTISQLDRVLAAPECWHFEYRASW